MDEFMEFFSYATCTSPIMHLICSPKFCTTFVLHFSWVLQLSQEEIKNNAHAIVFFLREMCKWRILTRHIQGTKGREKGRVLGIMGWCIHPTKQRGLETSSYDFKVYFHRMHSPTGFLIIGCRVLLSWSKVVPYSALIPLRGFELL